MQGFSSSKNLYLSTCTLSLVLLNISLFHYHQLIVTQVLQFTANQIHTRAYITDLASMNISN